MSSMGIFEAARSNDLQRIKYLVEKERVSVSSMKSIGETIAHIAVRNNNLEMLKYVLFKDPLLLERMDDHDLTIFQLAVERGNLDIVKYLVEEHNQNIFDRHVHDYNVYETALQRIIKYGHLDILKYFVGERKFDVDAPNAHQHGPLIFLAMEYRKPHITRYLIEEAKAKVTTLNSKGENILFVAVEQDDLILMKCVLEKRNATLDINWRRPDGKTLIHMAAIGRKMTMIKYLVEERNADVNIADIDKNTPLHYVSGDYECTKYLIMHGADAKKKNGKDKTVLQLYHRLPIEIIVQRDLNFLKNLLDVQKIEFDLNYELELACEYKRLTIVQYLAEEQNAVGRPDVLGDILLRSVKNPSSDDWSRIYIRLGADLKVVDENGNTPLHNAIISRNLNSNGTDPLYKYLVEQGSNVNQKNNNGDTPVHLAVSSGNEKLCQYLIEEHSVEINQKNINGETPLHLAVSSGNEKLCEYLVQNHADINTENNKGLTPLHYTVFYAKKEICEFLIKQNASIDPKTKRGCTPLHLAAKRGNQKICEYLVKRGADINWTNMQGFTPLHNALLHGHERLFIYLASYNTTIVDMQETPILHFAAKHDYFDVLNYMIVQKKADVNFPRKKDNRTALHYAALRDRRGCFQLLIKHHANINATDGSGKTPLDLLGYKENYRNRRSVVDFLCTSSYQNRFNLLRVDGNVDQDVHRDLSGILSSTYVAQFQYFLTFIQLTVRKMYSQYYAETTVRKPNFSTTSRLCDRTDPFVEQAIITLPNIRE